jgi:hypothetical protein
MKLTTTQLKQIIKEELDNVMSEYRTLPQFPEGFPEDFQAKIHGLIDSGEPQNIEMARSLMDSFGASDYVDKYIDYLEVGTAEKFGRKVGLLKKANKEERKAARSAGDRSMDSEREAYNMYMMKQGKIDAEAEQALRAIADRTGENYDDLYKRYVASSYTRR